MHRSSHIEHQRNSVRIQLRFPKPATKLSPEVATLGSPECCCGRLSLDLAHAGRDAGLEGPGNPGHPGGRA